MPNAKYWAVVPAGGSGSRFSSVEDKLLVSLAGKPVLIRTISALLKCAWIEGIVVTASESNLHAYTSLLTAEFPTENLMVTLGGDSRRASVLQGLSALPDHVEVVVVHDAARPLIQAEIIRQAVLAVQNGANGCVIAIPVVDTVKQVNVETMVIDQTLDRATLWRAQTPQVFKRRVLLKAHRQIPVTVAVTDDAQLLELARLGPVQIIPGMESNLKITSRDDIPIAEAFLRQLEGVSH